MNDADAREELFEAIRALADAAPGMRIGQLIAGAGEICSSLHGRGLWDAEEHELLEAVWKFQKDLLSSFPAEHQAREAIN
jgi:hypothetical protein